MKIVYAGTPDFAVAPLRALVEKGCEIVAVVTREDRPFGRHGVLTPPPVKAFALSAGIPVYQFGKIREHVSELASLGADAMFTCAYGQLLTQAVLDVFPKGVWNAHASLLPKFRGASPVQSAILAGERVTGVTVMKTELALDGEYLRRYIELLRQMRDEYGLRDDISVMTVAANRDIFTETESGATEQDTEDIMSVISRAVDTFIAMRIAEGENICRDLCKKLEHLGALVGEIEREEPRMNEAYRARLEAKLRAVLEGRGAGAPDEARIITECAIFADKVAVDEETVRLRSHLDAFGAALSSDDAVGRRLDFLVQEIGREINTIGSKVSDVHMTDTVVEMKSELERIREQVQNLE